LPPERAARAQSATRGLGSRCKAAGRGVVERRSQLAFLLLILAQAAHSIEEYVTRLYEVFAPARFVSSLISSDLSAGFLVANAALVAFGAWCSAVPMRSGWRAARGLAWFWALLELGNGFGHSALALSRAGYFPGALTAPLLLVCATWLAALLLRHADRSSPLNDPADPLQKSR